MSRLNDGVCDCVNGADEWLREVDYCKFPISERKFLRDRFHRNMHHPYVHSRRLVIYNDDDHENYNNTVVYGVIPEITEDNSSGSKNKFHEFLGIKRVEVNFKIANLPGLLLKQAGTYSQYRLLDQHPGQIQLVYWLMLSALLLVMVRIDVRRRKMSIEEKENTPST